MRTLLILLFLAPLCSAADPAPILSPKEIADGWVMLFDGESTFGWKIEGESEVKDGKLILGGTKETKATSSLKLADARVRIDYERIGDKAPSVKIGSVVGKANSSEIAKVTLDHSFKSESSPLDAVEITVPAGTKAIIRKAKVLPGNLSPLFNGKDLTGWKVFPGEKYKSVYSVTKEGWLNVKNGPGDLQTEKTYKDFALQLDCISNGNALNSGVFFRCLKDQYQNGYEMQIQNGIKDGDRTKPADFGTGAIYRRIPARKVVSNDREWFTMTLVARGNHLRTFVNGYPTVDWTDDRKVDDNARKGAKIGAGHLSLQGHDPTTDLSFRNIRIAEFRDEK